MIRHVALLRFGDGVTSEAIEALTNALLGLPDAIPEIAAFSCGPDVGGGPTSVDYGVVADFASMEDYRTYAEHPVHLDVIARHITPILDRVVRVQFPLPQRRDAQAG
jgi:hypothetical protein